MEDKTAETVQICRGKDGKFMRTPGIKTPKKGKKKQALEKMTVEELLAKLNSDTLDNRTMAGNQFDLLKTLLDKDSQSTVIALLKQDIAVNSILIQSIVEHYQSRNGRIKFEGGELPKALTQDLPKFQTALGKSALLLMRLEHNLKQRLPKLDTNISQDDIADLVLGLDVQED